MPKISTIGLQSQKKLFHNVHVNVYQTTLALNEIKFWKENDRTIFTFERLKVIKGKDISELSLEEVTRFVASQDIHKLQILADSIGRNGVQVPLVIRDDGKLLDGNRRFFACHWLRMQCVERGKSVPDFLLRIPVQIIKSADLTDTLELKILAEANFIPDLKVAWPLDAQARAVERYYKEISREKRLDHESALAEVVAVFGINRQRVVDLLDTLKLTNEFINADPSVVEQLRRREIVEEKFVYLWEFRNKALKGSNAFHSSNELADVKSFFFQLMAKGRDNPIRNVKQIEPLVQAKRDTTAWSMLKESKGKSLKVVVSMMNDKKEIRKSEDKIRVFISWLSDVSDLTPKAKGLLKEVVVLSKRKISE